MSTAENNSLMFKGTDPKVLRRLAERSVEGKRRLFARMGLGEPREFVGRDMSAEIARIFPDDELDDVSAD